MKVSIINTLFLPLHAMLYASRIKLLAERLVLKCTPCCNSSSSAKQRPQSSAFKKPKRWKSEGAKSGLWGGWERTNSSHSPCLLEQWRNLVNGILEERCYNLEQYVQTLKQLQQLIWRVQPKRKMNQVLIFPTVLI